MKKGLFLLLIAPMLTWGLSSCVEVKTDASKLDGKWIITAVKGEKVTSNKVPFMEFKMADKKVSGNAGCNMFTSVAKLDAHNISLISLAPAAATMMACLDMEWEGKIMKTFDQIYSVKKGENPDEMLLLNENQEVLLVLQKSNE